MSLFLQLVIGGLMIGLTVAIHAMALDTIIKQARHAESLIWRLAGKLWKPVMSAIIVLFVIMSHIAQIWIWALLYLARGCAPLKGVSDALYFSTVSYTTVGFGDITLDHSCRMLSGVEAMNGFIVVGWTTAFIFEVISQLYKREATAL